MDSKMLSDGPIVRYTFEMLECTDYRVQFVQYFLYNCFQFKCESRLIPNIGAAFTVSNSVLLYLHNIYNVSLMGFKFGKFSSV